MDIETKLKFLMRAPHIRPELKERITAYLKSQAQKEETPKEETD
jgi:hypothetical protein